MSFVDIISLVDSLVVENCFLTNVTVKKLIDCGTLGVIYIYLCAIVLNMYVSMRGRKTLWALITSIWQFSY